MADGDFFRDDARTSPRFVPKDHLSMFLAGSAAPLVHGDIKDLSERGACVRTDSALDNGGVVTINVRNGYSFLFRAEARIVWRAAERRPRDDFDCAHGIRFTELTPFTRKLIRRLGGDHSRAVLPPASAPIAAEIWDADSDPDLQIVIRSERSPAEVDEDRLDLLTDPLLEASLLAERVESVSFPDFSGTSVVLPEPAPPVPPPVPASALVAPDPTPEPKSEPKNGYEPFDAYLDGPSSDNVESIEWRDAAEAALAPKLRDVQETPRFDGEVELSGNLGYFDNADVLQMLEATRATGVLYIDGPVSGEIQLLEGRICRCVSQGLSEDEAAFHLVVACSGRFHFVPCPVPENARRIRTTTQLVLEAQLRRDHGF